MKTTVVCGLLGAGKTTFIGKYLKDRGERTVVLVNDFGAAGIDGEIFSAGGVESVELPSGCVCCTLRFDLIRTIEKIVRQFAPLHLVIEPSGVASPSGVLEALQSAGFSDVTVIGIVDVVEFLELLESGMFGSFFEDQIAFSDVILVNKIDCAAEETIAATIERLESMNPRAVVLRTERAELAGPLPVLSPSARVRQGGNSHIRYHSVTVRPLKIVSLPHLTRQLEELATGAYGKVVRAKALVRTDQGPHRFDIVFGRLDRVVFEREIEDSRIVVIGEGLDEEGIRRALG